MQSRPIVQSRVPNLWAARFEQLSSRNPPYSYLLDLKWFSFRGTSGTTGPDVIPK
jgi:hypothetical protein